MKNSFLWVKETVNKLLRSRVASVQEKGMGGQPTVLNACYCTVNEIVFDSLRKRRIGNESTDKT